MFHYKIIVGRLFITTLICTICFGCILSGCSSNDEPTEDTNDSGVVEFEFQLCLGSATETRATSATVYSEDYGTEDENYIDMDNIHLLLYNPANGSAAGGASWNCELIPTIKRTISVGEGRYYVKCTLPSEKLRNSDNSVKPFVLAVTANWPKTPCYNNRVMMFLGLMNADDFTYDYGYDSDGNPTYYEPSKDNPIPMYGVKLVNNYTALASVRKIYQLGEIYMDRALAKIIVKDVKGGKISNVKLTKCVNRGLCAPWGMYAEVDEVTSDYVTIPRDVTSAYSTATSCTYDGVTSTYPSELGYIDDLPFKKVADNTFIAYVPEYRNVSTANPAWGSNPSASAFHDPGISTLTSATTAITFTANNKSYTLEFKDCDDNGNQIGDIYNIIRNHVYTFYVDFGENLMLFYVVEDWNEYTAGDIEYE